MSAFQIAKTNDAQHLVFGYASVAVAKDGSDLEDTQGDVIPPDELENAAYDYVLTSRASDEMHDQEMSGQLVESVVFTPEKLAAMAADPATGETDPELLKTLTTAFPPRWWVGFKLDPAAYAGVKSGKYTMFSIGATAERVPADEAAA
jgi:hypothetical protein